VSGAGTCVAHVHNVRHLSALLGLGLLLGTAVALAACGDAGTEVADDEVQARLSGAGSVDFATYAAFASQHGKAPSDRTLVIGIRGRDPAGNLHPTRVSRVFDDTLIVLTPDKRAIVLPVSTHPWETQSTNAGVPDVDRDGRVDVGMIRPGTYRALKREAKRDIAGAGTYHVTMPEGRGTLPGYRNTDHDDVYSPAERTASESRSDGLTDVLFHVGGAGAPQAVGCQVLDASGIRRLVTEGGAGFDYLLVDANDESVP
jgi:hypothetical protein